MKVFIKNNCKHFQKCISSILMAHNSMIIDSGSTCQSCCSYINLMPSKDILRFL